VPPPARFQTGTEAGEQRRATDGELGLRSEWPGPGPQTPTPLDAINDATNDLDHGRLQGRGILVPAGAE
jgi:hypothetical protein